MALRRRVRAACLCPRRREPALRGIAPTRGASRGRRRRAALQRDGRRGASARARAGRTGKRRRPASRANSSGGSKNRRAGARRRARATAASARALRDDPTATRERRRGVRRAGGRRLVVQCSRDGHKYRCPAQHLLRRAAACGAEHRSCAQPRTTPHARSAAAAAEAAAGAACGSSCSGAAAAQATPQAGSQHVQALAQQAAAAKSAVGAACAALRLVRPPLKQRRAPSRRLGERIARACSGNGSPRARFAACAAAARACGAWRDRTARRKRSVALAVPLSASAVAGGHE